MSARIPPGFAEAWMSFSVAGDPELMYTAVGIDLAVGVSASLGATNTILAQLQVDMAEFVDNVVTVGPGYVLWGQDGDDIRIDGTNATSAGTATGNAGPPNVALLIRKVTALGGRRHRGRFYIPGIAKEVYNEAGVIPAAGLASFQTNANDLLTNMVGLSDVEGLVLLHSSAPFTPTAITALQVQNKVATQRRRLRP